MAIFQILLGAYFALNVVMLWRLYRALRGKPHLWIPACLIAFALAIAFPLSRMLSLPPLPARFLAIAGALWLAFFWYVLLLTFFVDLFRLFNRLFDFAPRLRSGDDALRRTTCGAIAVGAASITVAGWFIARTPTVRELEIDLSASGNPVHSLRVAALSDIHLGRIISAKRLERFVDLIVSKRPDLVLFVGDVLDDYEGLDPAAMKAALGRLQPPLGVWGVPGNHEYISGRIEDSLRILEQCGIRMLRDEWTVLDEKLLLVGRDDVSKSRFSDTPRLTLSALLSEVPPDARKHPMLLMDHQPVRLEEAEQAGAWLQLSGHTHHGQIWPFNYVVAGIFENSFGYSRRGATHYWVSAGAGTWGPPVRTTGRPEILMIVLRY